MQNETQIMQIFANENFRSKFLSLPPSWIKNSRKTHIGWSFWSDIVWQHYFMHLFLKLSCLHILCFGLFI